MTTNYTSKKQQKVNRKTSHKISKLNSNSVQNNDISSGSGWCGCIIIFGKVATKSRKESSWWNLVVKRTPLIIENNPNRTCKWMYSASQKLVNQMSSDIIRFWCHFECLTMIKQSYPNIHKTHIRKNHFSKQNKH